MRIRCPQCKTIQSAPAQFCKGCGVRFESVAIQSKSPLRAIVIILLIFGFVGFLFVGKSLREAQIDSRLSRFERQTTLTNFEGKQKVARREIVEKSRLDLAKGETDVALIGENEDVLFLSAKRLTSGDILGMMRPNFNDFRGIGFKKIIAIGKSGDKQEMDLIK